MANNNAKPRGRPKKDKTRTEHGTSIRLMLFDQELANLDRIKTALKLRTRQEAVYMAGDIFDQLCDCQEKLKNEKKKNQDCQEKLQSSMAVILDNLGKRGNKK